jgi:dissimilatory sulfite reductase (desulfoviridin) alpha/beta subunit
VGGKHGKHPIHSWEIAQFVSDEGCLALIEETLEWYRAQGRGRERIGATIVRLGLEEYIEKVVRPLGLEAIDTPEARRKFRAGGNVYL